MRRMSGNMPKPKVVKAPQKGKAVTNVVTSSNNSSGAGSNSNIPQQKQPLSLVNDRFVRARSYRVTTQDDIWKRSYNNWRGVLDQSKFPWRSKLFIPWSFTVVETIIPKVFARDPNWRALARSHDVPEDEPDTVSDLLEYQWGRMGMRIKMYDYIKDSLMYSKGFAKVGWNFQVKNKTFMEPQVGKDDVITFKKTTKSDVEYDDPTIDIVDPYDIYVDPDATSLDDAAYLIHRKTVPLDDVKDNPNYKNTDQIEGNSYADQYADKLNRYQNNVPEKDKHKDLVEILEYWGRDDRLVVVANRSVVLRDTPNPYNHKEIPFVELDDYRDPHRFYGQSELSVIDPLQREINSIRNQRRDYDNLALNPVIRMVPGTLRNPNSAVMAPGNVWMVSDLQSMDVFELPQLQGTAVQIEEMTAADIQRTVAIDEIAIGLLPANPQRRSATEVNTSQQSAGKRFSMKVALLEEAVKKMGKMIYALDQQFLDKQRTIQIVGQDGLQNWIRLGPADVRNDYDIDIETGSMLPKDEVAQRQEAVELLQYVAPIMARAAGTMPSVMFPILKLILGTFDLPNIEDIVKELGQVLGVADQINAQQMQAQNAATEAQAINTTQQAQATHHQTAMQAQQQAFEQSQPQQPQGGKK